MELVKSNGRLSKERRRKEEGMREGENMPWW